MTFFSQKREMQLRDGEQWFVLQYLARQERTAALNLEAQNFKVFFPQISKVTRHARKVREKLVPFFPGYMFVALNLQKDRWRSINGTYGVARLLMAEKGPIPMPPGIVEALVNDLDEDGKLNLDQTFTVGQRVRIGSGPFSSLVGHIYSLDDKGRARILLEIMSGTVVTTLPRTALEADS